MVTSSLSPSPFDEVVSREGLGLLGQARARFGKPADVTPLWLADMGFRTPENVRRVLGERVASGIIGYSVPTSGYYEALGGWFERRHGWVVDPRKSVLTRGVVHAVHLALDALTEPGDGVVIQPPVYQPFFDAVRATGRRLLTSELVAPDQTDRGWQIDFDDFEAKARQARAFILCSPHNPVGRVWTRPELERLADICLRHGVTIISDEIHQDFVYPGACHTVTASLGAEIDAITVTCTAPSKTFNLAGLQLANVFVSEPAMRRRLADAYARQGLSQHPALSLAACEAAYGGEADQWVDALVAYLDATLAAVADFVSERLPGVRFWRPEGTYFAWLDFRGLGLAPDALERAITGGAGLWLSDGATFGPGGDGFRRLVAAEPRAVILQALERLAQALGAGARRDAGSPVARHRPPEV